MKDLRAGFSSPMVRVEGIVLLLRMTVTVMGSDSDDSGGDTV